MTDEIHDSPSYTPQTLVDHLRANGHLSDARVDYAFSRVARERFLPNTPLDVVYSDTGVPILHNNEGHTTVSSTLPSMIASLLTSAQLQEGLNVLHINTGTGYTAALISQIIGTSGHITSLEVNRELASKAENTLLRAGFSSVSVVNRDAVEGYAPRAQYDRIISSAGIWDIPLSWKRQLKPDGAIITPIWLDGLQILATLRLQPDGSLLAENIKPSIFVYLQGQEGVPAFRRRLGNSALTLLSDDIARLDLTALHWLLSQDHDQDNHFSHSLRSKEYWYGFLPYIAINEGIEDVFALYSIDPERPAYGGMTGEGFAYFTPASACFVPYFGIGNSHTFAGSDAFLEVEALINQWEGDKRPGLDHLRIRFIPREAGISADTAGKVYPRRNHIVHAWMEL
jgi:protein-L-isoaspartate(D-aspartate) O-methyltransferase